MGPNREALRNGDARMSERPLRMLLVATHPVQYAAPVFKLLAEDPRVQIQVAYCSMLGTEAEVDLDFGVPVKWDIPLLEGYPWTLLPNRSGKAKLGSFFGLFNPGAWRLISRGRFDAVVLYTGYVYSTFWVTVAAAKWHRACILFGTDAYDLSPRDKLTWKTRVKKWAWPRLFRLADQVIIVSSGSASLMRSLGICEDRIALTPFCVDNEGWIAMSDRVDRGAVRGRWNVPTGARVVLFCAKLQTWKRPQDLLRAFARISDPDTFLVFAGEGPLRRDLESEAGSLGIAERVRFLGFVNQSALPQVYTASDIFVLPSEYEPFGLVVNESMLCRCPAIVSDRVGARFDLIRENETGYVFPCGSVDALAATLERSLSNRMKLREMGHAARARMATWSPTDYVNGLIGAVSKAVEAGGEARARVVV